MVPGGSQFVESMRGMLTAEQEHQPLSLDLGGMSKVPFDAVCVDLLMYESPALFTAVFSVLLREYSSRSALRNQVLLSKESR